MTQGRRDEMHEPLAQSDKDGTLPTENGLSLIVPGFWVVSLPFIAGFSHFCH